MNILRIKRKNGFKKFKFKRLILFIFFLIMSTFAWFVYYKILNVGIEGHISSWNVEFLKDNQKIGNELNVEFDTLYPLMPEQVKSVKIKNNGDAITKITYNINEVDILGNKYDIVKAKPLENEFYLLDSDPIIDANKIKNKYIVNDKERIPFTIKIENTDELLGNEEGTVDIKINWIGDNNELDTKWGYDVAKFIELNPSQKSVIKIKLKLSAFQIPKSDYSVINK